MENQKRLVIPVDDELFMAAKIWAAKHSMTIAEAGRLFFTALVNEDIQTAGFLDLLRLLDKSGTLVPKQKGKG